MKEFDKFIHSLLDVHLNHQRNTPSTKAIDNKKEAIIIQMGVTPSSQANSH